MVNLGGAPNDIDNVQDLWYALREAGLVSGDLSNTEIDDGFKVHQHGYQPDGDFVGSKADGQLFDFSGTLAAGEEYESEWFDTDGWRNIELFIDSNQKSALDGIEVEYTSNVQTETPEIDGTVRDTFGEEDAAHGWKAYNYDVKLDGIRIRYINGDTPTDDDFMITSTARTSAALEAPTYVDETVAGDTIIRVGNEPTGPGLKIGNPSSLFGDLETISRQSVVDLTSSFGTSILRDEVLQTGSGSIGADPNNNGEIELTTGTTSGSDVVLSSAEYGRYTPGYSSQMGMGVRLQSPLPTSGEAKWGYYDSNNGFYFGYDGEQQEMFVARLSDGVETDRVYRSDWNGQDINENLSRGIWSPGEGDIWQIDFSWYGYGIILFTLVSQTADTPQPITPEQTSIRLHALRVEGETSTSDPNQPIRAEISNGTTTDNNVMYIGGRQFSVFGEPPAERRITSETRTGAPVTSGAWSHIMSWQRGDPQNDANSKLNIDSIDFSSNQTMRVALVINANISSTTYNYPSLTNSNETLLNVSTVGTYNGIGDGTKVWEGHINVSGQGNASNDIGADVDVRFGQNGVLSLLAYGVGGSGSANATMRMVEDW